MMDKIGFKREKFLEVFEVLGGKDRKAFDEVGAACLSLWLAEFCWRFLERPPRC